MDVNLIYNEYIPYIEIAYTLKSNIWSEAVHPIRFFHVQPPFCNRIPFYFFSLEDFQTHIHQHLEFCYEIRIEGKLEPSDLPFEYKLVRHTIEYRKPEKNEITRACEQHFLTLWMQDVVKLLDTQNLGVTCFGSTFMSSEVGHKNDSFNCGLDYLAFNVQILLREEPFDVEHCRQVFKKVKSRKLFSKLDCNHAQMWSGYYQGSYVGLEDIVKLYKKGSGKLGDYWGKPFVLNI